MIYVTPIITLIKITIYEIYVWVPWRLLWCILCSIYTSSYWPRNLKKLIRIIITNQFHGKKRKKIFTKKDLVNFGSALFLNFYGPLWAYSFWSLGISRFTNLSFEKKMKMVYGWALLNNFEFFQRNKNMNQITTQQQHVDLA